MNVPSNLKYYQPMVNISIIFSLMLTLVSLLSLFTNLDTA